MARLFPALVLVALTIYAVVDLTQTDSSDVPYMPKWMWLIIAIFLPVAGPIAWILLGHFNLLKSVKNPETPPDDNEDWLRTL